jgi:hypothetical protein
MSVAGDTRFYGVGLLDDHHLAALGGRCARALPSGRVPRKCMPLHITRLILKCG